MQCVYMRVSACPHVCAYVEVGRERNVGARDREWERGRKGKSERERYRKKGRRRRSRLVRVREGKSPSRASRDPG